MAGAGLNQLRLRRQFDPARYAGFETESRCRRLDRANSQLLRAAARCADPNIDPGWLRQLGQQLRYQPEQLPPATRASRLSYREQRRVLGSQIAWRIDEAQRARDPVTLFTLIPVGLDLSPDQVLRAKPWNWARQLHATLDRIMVRHGLQGTGWAAAFLDCEYQQAEDRCQFHWHGFATGDQLRAIDLLRHTVNYRSPRRLADGTRAAVRHRVHLTRGRLENLEQVSVYPLKPEWQTRTVPSNQAGNRARTWPAPIPETLRVTERLFFDRWPIETVSVIRGLRVVEGDLRPT